MKLIMVVMALLRTAVQSVITCNRTVMNSYGLDGLRRITFSNTICPDLKYNCCSQRDILKLYKRLQDKSSDKETVDPIKILEMTENLLTSSRV